MALIKNNSHCGVKYLDRFAELVCHVADDPEDDEAGEHAGDAVADGDNDCVPEHVVVEVVVACQGDHHPPRHAWDYQPIREQSDVQSTNQKADTCPVGQSESRQMTSRPMRCKMRTGGQIKSSDWSLTDGEEDLCTRLRPDLSRMSLSIIVKLKNQGQIFRNEMG